MAIERERRLQLSLVQVLASLLASVSAAVVASVFGVAGTVIGAAVASVVATVGSAIYSASIRRTNAQMRRIGEELARRSGTRTRARAPGASRRPQPTRPSPSRPASAATALGRSSPAGRWRRWSVVGGGVVAVFVLAMAVITAVELLAHRPVAALVGRTGSAGGATSIVRLTGVARSPAPRHSPGAPASPAPSPDSSADVGSPPPSTPPSSASPSASAPAGSRSPSPVPTSPGPS